MENEVLNLKLDDIIPNRFQPREVFDEQALNELADSIKNHGVLEPILVRPVANKYEIIAGERRYKASVIAGMTSIPALVRKMDDKEASIVAFIENAQRKDVSAIESARTAQRILKSNNMTQEDLASSLGISQSYLANKLRLLALPLEVQDSLMKGEISERHARSLLSVKEESKQLELLKEIKERRMTVRELDGEIKSMNNGFTNLDNNMSMLNNNGENNNNYMNFLNNNVVGNNMNSENNVPQQNPGFNDFLNNYDNNHPVENTNSEFTTTGNGFMEYLNSYDANNPPQENVAQSEQGFNNFLNNYDNNHPVENTNNEFTTTGNGFMEYLNSYDANNPAQENVAQQNSGFNEFLNNYDNNHPVDNAPLIEQNNNIASMNSNANGYVEDNPNYVDISKAQMLNDVDSIIDELKETISRIKTQTNLKIDTDEINYDDIYQITIKIDKRDF